MVLPARIELATSALPRMRSTTELRQQAIRVPGVWGPGDWLSSDAAPRYGRGVTDRSKETREERLAKALRANLARRKARDRAAEAGDVPAEPPKD